MTRQHPGSEPDGIPRYQQIADQIAGMIDGGTFKPGARVPSLRRLSRQMSVSLTTAMEAYRVLEDRGLIEARPQSGFYVKAPRPLPPPPAKTVSGQRAVDLTVNELFVTVMRKLGDHAIVPLGAAGPHPGFLPTDALNRILAREARSHSDLSQSYDEGRGHPGLRTQIARRALEAGCALSADEIISTAGAQQAVYLSLAATTSPGDSVIVETPTYVGLLQVLEMLRLKALEVSTDPTNGICLDCLAEALEQPRVAACVLIPTFGNPLGHCMPEDLRERLVAMVASAGVPLIEDDIYGELHFDRSRPRALKAFDRTGNVLLCSSLSKTLAPGFRVGWVAAGRWAGEIERLKYIVSVACPSPTQMAAAVFLESGGFDRHLRRLRSTYRGLVTRMSAAVAEHFPEGTRISRPRGGHVLWVELPPEADSIRLFDRALQHGISLAPGPLFSACGDYRNFIRLNCSVPWSDTIEGAIRTLGSLVEEQLSVRLDETPAVG
jgi:DNA-binding transcriptional MocR family regulator